MTKNTSFSLQFTCAWAVPVHTYDITTQAPAQAQEEEKKVSFFLCLNPPLPPQKETKRKEKKNANSLFNVATLGAVTQSPEPEARDQYAQRLRFWRESSYVLMLVLMLASCVWTSLPCVARRLLLLFKLGVYPIVCDPFDSVTHVTSSVQWEQIHRTKEASRGINSVIVPHDSGAFSGLNYHFGVLAMSAQVRQPLTFIFLRK